MKSFSELIARWETFYLLSGTAAATLMGLLFVAFSIHIENFRRETYADLQRFAALTFNSFFYALIISLWFLIPGLSVLGLGIPMLLLGLLSLGNVVYQRRQAHRIQLAHEGVSISGKFTLPIISLVVLVAAAVGVMLQIPYSLYGFVLVIVMLLISASVNAFSLLVQIKA